MSKKIEKECHQLSEKTGIQFKKYTSPELIEKISDLIGFLGQIRSVMTRCNLLFMALISALSIYFAYIQMNTAGVVIFFLFGICFSILAGSALGTWRLAERAVGDSIGVVTLMLDFIKEVKKDLLVAKKNQPGSDVSTSNLLKGISYGVFIPSINGIVRDQLSFFAKPVILLIENAIFYFTKSLAAALEKTESQDNVPENMSRENNKTEITGTTETGTPDTASGTSENKFIITIDKAKGMLNTLSAFVIKQVTIPSKILFTLTMLIGVPILWLIYYIFS
ncbi:MAG: hypothetical protein GY757_01480 [bacterium]|nr:hypothetical protein [bacterium]